MPKLTFDITELRAQLADAERAWALAPAQELYGEKTGPGFYFVGDDGVYLLHNGATHIGTNGAVLGDGERGTRAVCYAKQCPQGDDDAKRRIWGGDDGVEFLDAKTIRAWIAGPGKTRTINLTTTAINLVVEAPAKEGVTQ